MYIEGQIQELQYGMSQERLWYKLHADGRDITTTTTITLQVWDPANDDKLVSSTTMTRDTGALYYHDIDLSDTDTWDIDEGYIAQVDFEHDSRKRRKYIYFDVVFHPFNEPIVTSEHIDARHPDWKRMHPSGSSGTWTQCIEDAHAEIARRIRASGERPSSVPKMQAEIFPYELAFAEAEIATTLTRMTPEQRSWYVKQAENLWKSRGEFSTDTDDDAEIDDDPRTLGQPRKTR